MTRPPTAAKIPSIFFFQGCLSVHREANSEREQAGDGVADEGNAHHSGRNDRVAAPRAAREFVWLFLGGGC